METSGGETVADVSQNPNLDDRNSPVTISLDLSNLFGPEVVSQIPEGLKSVILEKCQSLSCIFNFLPTTKNLTNLN